MIFIPIHLEDKVSLPDFLMVVPGVIYKTLFISSHGSVSSNARLLPVSNQSPPYSCLTYPFRLFLLHNAITDLYTAPGVRHVCDA